MALFLVSCNKSKFKSAPQISFLSLTPDRLNRNEILSSGPVLSFHVTDAEGDFGYIDNNTKSVIKVLSQKDTLTDTFTFDFPQFSGSNMRNFNADVSVNIANVIVNSLLPHTFPSPSRVDTVRFKFYVQDFAGNHSNVVETGNLYYTIP